MTNCILSHHIISIINQIKHMLSKLINCSSTMQKFMPLRTCYCFARSNNSKTKYEDKTDEFEKLQMEYANEYFQQYREQVENDTVIRDFRKQIFDKNNKPPGQRQLQQSFEKQQKQLDKLLSEGSKEKVVKFSKKIMQHFANKRLIFKGNQTKNVFKEYADYSAYKTNSVSVEDRNYQNLDFMYKPKNGSKIYEFIDKLPDNYNEKIDAQRQIQLTLSQQAENLSITEYGKILEQHQNNIWRMNQINGEVDHQNNFKMRIQQKDGALDEQTVYDTPNQFVSSEDLQPFQEGILSADAKNKIYDLYLQGWSVRQISQRFGILPQRTKFVIWCRARIYNQFLPRYGIKFLFYMIQVENEEMMQSQVIDYGLDLEELCKTDKYDQITSWTNEYVDAQRTPQQYTEALQKLEKRNKFDSYDIVQVGVDGKENKKHLLKEWKVHRGKKSDIYFLKNKVFNKLMFENRKKKSVYY